jgi:hypothetical protein
MDVLENQAFALSDEDASFLQRRLGGLFEPRTDGWAVCRMVGHLRLPSGVILRIRSPKASTASLLSWLAYVDPSLASLRLPPSSANKASTVCTAARTMGTIRIAYPSRAINRGATLIMRNSPSACSTMRAPHPRRAPLHVVVDPEVELERALQILGDAAVVLDVQPQRAPHGAALVVEARLAAQRQRGVVDVHSVECVERHELKERAGALRVADDSPAWHRGSASEPACHGGQSRSDARARNVEVISTQASWRGSLSVRACGPWSKGGSVATVQAASAAARMMVMKRMVSPT